MRFHLPLAILLGVVAAKPQGPPPPPVSIPPQEPSPVPVPSTKTIYSPVPAPSDPAPSPVPPPDSPLPPAPPAPTVSGGPDGPICECGYTYCASVLAAMKKPWSEKQLEAAYCSTSGAICTNGIPSTNVTSALYICLCEDSGQRVGTDLDLICGCDNCLNVGPDYRGRCQTPGYSGGVCNNNGGDGGGGGGAWELVAE